MSKGMQRESGLFTYNVYPHNPTLMRFLDSIRKRAETTKRSLLVKMSTHRQEARPTNKELV